MTDVDGHKNGGGVSSGKVMHLLSPTSLGLYLMHSPERSPERWSSNFMLISNLNVARPGPALTN